MPVRNVQAIGRRKPIPIHVWIPPKYSSEYKIEVTRSDGTVDDITDAIFEGEIINGATDFIGNFSFVLDNSAEQYKGVWTGNEIIKQYSDYAESATTARFRGRIERVSYQNNQVKITGRSESMKLLGIHVNASGTNIETSVILKALFNSYATDFTYTNVNTSSTKITINWYQKPLLECIQELCIASGFDFYIDSDLDAHYFEAGSVQNTTEAVVHDMNILSVDGFGEDYSLIKNRIYVEGGEIESLPLLYTAEDTGSTYGTNSDLGVREIIIKDDNIKTSTQAQERADIELSVVQDPTTIGEVECIGLATIQPGEYVRISAPDSNIAPNFYKIISYRHTFLGGMITHLTINKEALSMQEVMKKRISYEKEVNVKNAYGMKYSWNFDFSSDSGSHSNTQITDGVLKTTGGASGTWTSDLLEIPTDVTPPVELRIVGTSLYGVKGRLSTNGGLTDTQIYGAGTGVGAALVAGKKLKLKIILASANTQVTGAALLYK